MKIISSFVISTLVIVAFYSTCYAKIPPQARQVLYKAQLLMDKNSYNNATKVIEHYIKTTNEKIDSRIYLTLGTCLHQTDKIKQAYAILKKGLKSYPNNEYLCRNTAVTACELEKYYESGSLLEKLYSLQKKPTPQILFQAGSMYYQCKKYKKTISLLEKIINQTKSPDNKWILLDVHALIEEKQINKAKKMLLRYLNASPENDAYWRLLAKLYMEKDNLVKAAGALEIAYRLKTPSQSDLVNLASIYSYDEAPIMAAKTLKRAYGDKIDPKQALKIASLYASAGRTDTAIKYLERYSNAKSDSFKKGKYLFSARRFKESKQAMKLALKTKDKGEARFYIALCAWELKDFKTARAQLSKITDKKTKRKSSGYLEMVEEIETARLEAAL